MEKVTITNCKIIFDESKEYTLKDVIIDQFIQYMNDKYKNIEFQRK